jgi:hypothetical protein
MTKYFGPTSRKAAFTSKETHTLLLDLLLIKAFGPEYLAWEPETVWAEVVHTFNTPVSEVNKGKIQANRTCFVVDRPYEAWDVFEKVAVSFGGSIPKFDVIQKPSPHVCGMALEVMRSIREHKITEEVYRYISALFLDAGFAFAPGENLAPCNKYLVEYVEPALAAKVKKAINAGVAPTFDGRHDTDVQVAKSRSVLDFIENDTRTLLKQIEVVIKGNK